MLLDIDIDSSLSIIATRPEITKVAVTLTPGRFNGRRRVIGTTTLATIGRQGVEPDTGVFLFCFMGHSKCSVKRGRNTWETLSKC